MSIIILDISLRLSLTSLESFFGRTWFLWWLIAVVILARWCWSTYFQGGAVDNAPARSWRSLYQMALLECDNSKLAVRIGEAEAAILQELGAQLFGGDNSERMALQNAMNNLRSLRESHPERSDIAQIAQEVSNSQ